MHRIIREMSLITCLVFAMTLVSWAGSVGDFIDDAVLTTKVKTTLLAAEGLSGLDINVETSQGVVQLSGFVDSPEQARQAVELAQSVEGVKSVENKLSVK